MIQLNLKPDSSMDKLFDSNASNELDTQLQRHDSLELIRSNSQAKKYFFVLKKWLSNKLFFESENAFHASKKYLIELGNKIFDTKKWNQLNTFLWI